MIQSFLCIPHIPVGYAGGTTPRMGEVELRREQQSRAPTVGALGAASAPAHAKYLHPCRQRRSSCREHGVFKTLNQHGYFLRVLRVLCGELSFLLDLDNTFTVSRDWEPAVFLSVKCRVPDNFLQNKLALLS
jgi:hypothetical protein